MSYSPPGESVAAAASDAEGDDGDETAKAEGKGEDSPASTEKPEPTSSPPTVRGQPTVVKKRSEVDELAARFERLKNIR